MATINNKTVYLTTTTQPKKNYLFQFNFLSEIVFIKKNFFQGGRNEKQFGNR